MRPRVVSIVAAAGSGKRLGSSVKKPFVLLGGRPLVIYALKVLNDSPAIDAILIASDKRCVERFRRLVKKFKLNKVIDIVVGGDTRLESVKNCLARVDESFDIVLVHDSARPFVEKSIIERAIKLAQKFGACVVAVPENDTVKVVDSGLFIDKTLDRDRIYRAATPQAFRRELIKKAYELKDRFKITDDSGLAERLGAKVKILEGSYRNIKITTKVDLKIAEALL